MNDSILNVLNSLGKKKWIGNNISLDRQAEFLMQKCDVSILTATTLAMRGVVPENVTDYLNPKIKNLMPDPCLLSEMRTASDRLLKAVKNKERIAIYADFDVDGTTSASLLILWLRHNKMEHTLYIPDRLTEGYGPNIKAFSELAKKNTLLLCVDSGTQSFEPVKAAQSEGCDVIIIDHHQPSTKLPESFALVNPKKINEDRCFFNLCTAGLIFLFITDLNRLVRKEGGAEFNLLNYVDLVALATMADVVPLNGLNRALVTQGLKVIAKSTRPCFLSLAEKAKFRSPITAQALAFTFAPRINAAGRIKDAKLATKILISENLEEAKNYAEELETLNTTRKNLEQEVLVAALEQAKIQHKKGKKVLWSYGKNWHPGVIGIVAARIKEEYGKPAIVIAISQTGIGTGSARSTKDLDIGSSFLKLREKNLLVSGGGHSLAAGLKIEPQKIPAAQAALDSIYDCPNHEKTKNLQINAVLATTAISIELLEELNLAGPFGADSPFPVVAFPSCTVKNIHILAEKHLKVSFSNHSGPVLDGLLFNAFDSKIGEFLMKNRTKKIHLAGRVELNEWGGKKKANIIIVDIATQ